MAFELRPYQKSACDYCFEHLLVEGNSLLVAPTGAGKTIMFSDIAKRLVEHLTRVLGRPAHGIALIGQNEIHQQNLASFNRYAPHIRTAVFDSNIKSCRGNVIFAMIGSIFKYRKQLPMFDFVVIDETHHALAPNEFEFVQELKRKNEKLLVFGVSATPNRGDKIGLLPLFTNFYRIPIDLLMKCGYLVRPTFATLERPDSHDAFLQSIHDHKKGKTVVFCESVEEASVLSDLWNDKYPKEQSVYIHGGLPDPERIDRITKFKWGFASVIFNVAVLTEGFDDPEIETGVLARHYGVKGRYIQAVGRVLRPCPKIGKTEAIILDYAGNYEEHGGLQEDVDLIGSKSIYDDTGRKVRHLTEEDMFVVEKSSAGVQGTIKFATAAPRYFRPYESELSAINWFECANGMVGAYNAPGLGVIIVNEESYITHDKEEFVKASIDTVKRILKDRGKEPDSPPSNYQLKYLAGRYNITSLTKNRANAVILYDLFEQFNKVC